MNVDEKSMQKCLLSMIESFHTFSSRFQIQYYIASGTLLGAVRHKGFIPWDDDIDIYMLRDDYNRLIHGLYKELPSNLELRCYTTTDSIPTHFAKLINPNTTLVENKFANYVEGIYIDVFPLDGIDPKSHFDMIRWRYARFLNSILISKHQTTAKSNATKELFHGFCKLFNEYKLHKKIDRLLTSRKISDSLFVGDYLGAYDKKEIFNMKMFDKPILYEFNGIQLMGVRNYNEYLTQIYGDYLELPPPEKRVHKHEVFFIDYKMPYKEYKRRQV